MMLTVHDDRSPHTLDRRRFLQLAGLVPFLGFFLQIACLAVLGMGLARMHRTATWRGVCAALTPLVLGLVDAFTAAGLKCLGPSRAAAALEGSKAFAKAFMARHGVPTARFHTAESANAALEVVRAGSFGFPVVLKADGLAAGKGVVIANDLAEAERELNDGLQGLATDTRPRMLGEDALWYYRRGAARAALGRKADARADRPHRCRLAFTEPQFSITPGQAAVFYAGERVLGGGLIQA